MDFLEEDGPLFPRQVSSMGSRAQDSLGWSGRDSGLGVC